MECCALKNELYTCRLMYLVNVATVVAVLILLVSSFHLLEFHNHSLLKDYKHLDTMLCQSTIECIVREKLANN